MRNNRYRRTSFFNVYRAIYLVIFLLAAIGYVKNIIKLSDCDFESPYKAEVIHAIGIVPFVGAITGWLDVGK